MTSRPTAIARDIGDVVNALPSMFGFPPQDSLVALGLSGKRVAFGMRVDLSDVEDMDAAADYVVAQLECQADNVDVDGAIVVAVGEPLMVGRRLVLEVESRLFAGQSDDGRPLTVLPVAGGWATDDRFWVSMAGGDPDGYAYRRSIDHPTSLQAIAEGQEIVGSREELGAKLEPFGGIRRRWLDATAVHVAERWASASDEALAEDILPITHDLLAGRSVSDDAVLQLAYAVTRIPVRDSARSLITTESARDMVRVWMHVARMAPDEWAPPALCLTAYAALLRGDGAFSVTAAQRALQLDQTYSMARRLAYMATSGIAPEAWEAFDEGASPSR